MTALSAGEHGRVRVEAVLGWAAAGATVLLVYVAVVVGGGLLVGRADSPHLGLSVVATLVVALLVEPVRGRAEALGLRWLHRTQRSPYDVLTEFSREVARAGPVGEAPAVIARMLVSGLDVEWAQVWLVVDGEPRQSWTYPPDAAADGEPPAVYDSRPSVGLRSVTVSRGDRPLAVLRVRERDGRQLTAVEERLFSGLAAQAAIVLERAQLDAELQAKVRELSARDEDLRRARQELVATQDRERRALERDLHDGAQQQLVALAINLRLAKALLTVDPARARSVIEEQREAAATAICTLSDLSAGVVPEALELGLAAAVEAATAVNPVPVRVDAAEAGRLPAPVEAALYFCALEAVQNATKHAAASAIEVTLRRDGDRLTLLVEDDGAGIAAGAPEGSGLANIRERAAAIGGDLRVGSGARGGTRVAVVVPVHRDAAGAVG